jgi:hypothetical protein
MGYIDEAVDVIRPAVQQNDGFAIGRSGLSISKTEKTCIDLLQRCE